MPVGTGRPATPPRWRTRSCLCHALRMLADGLPVITVAHRCGWSAAGAFIDVLRRGFGHTPGTRHRHTRTDPTPLLTVE